MIKKNTCTKFVRWAHKTGTNSSEKKNLLVENRQVCAQLKEGEMSEQMVHGLVGRQNQCGNSEASRSGGVEGGVKAWKEEHVVVRVGDEQRR